MKKSSFVDYLLNDVFSSIEGISAKAMFGGYGLYKHDVIFGLIADDELYFKADDSNRPKYEARKSRPFAYEAKDGKRVVMSYWLVPGDILEDRDVLAEWVDEAVTVSRRSAKKAKH